MTRQDVINQLEALAHPSYQESYDNSGLLTCDPQVEVTGVMVSLDATEDVILEAKQRGCNMLVSHHPIVFSGLKSITGKTYIERAVMTSIKHDVALYAIHTNLDNVAHGVNAKIAETLELTNTQILSPKQPDENIGSGMIGDLSEATSPLIFLQFLKEKMQAGVVRYTELPEGEVKRIAVCGGSGSFLLEDAVAAGADVFVTADYKYHQFFDAENRIVIADIGHFESEQYTIELLHDYLCGKFSTFAVLKTAVVTNPVSYL